MVSSGFLGFEVSDFVQFFYFLASILSLFFVDCYAYYRVVCVGSTGVFLLSTCL